MGGQRARSATLLLLFGLLATVVFTGDAADPSAEPRGAAGPAGPAGAADALAGPPALRALLAPQRADRPGDPVPSGFPAGHTGYHTYSELIVELALLAVTHPDRVALSSYGTSVQDRPLPLVKISDNVGVDEDEPEVLFTCGLHGREHLTVEMCLHTAHRLAAAPGRVRDREVWVIPMANPDGAVHDVAGEGFARWRKNRQPNPDGSVGTDLNRNWPTRWGCCGGSSPEPGSPIYRGRAPLSAPETAALAAWVNSRVIDGRQQLTAHVDWHSFSELVLWPPTVEPNGADAMAYRGLARAMAERTGYTAKRVSDLYPTDGLFNDWMWAEHGIWSLTVEMFPARGGARGFYPPDSVIDRETVRNDAAVDLLLRSAGCVPCAVRS